MSLSEVSVIMNERWVNTDGTNCTNVKVEIEAATVVDLGVSGCDSVEARFGPHPPARTLYGVFLRVTDR